MKHTFDVAVNVLRPEGGHERGVLGGERGMRLFDPKRWIVTKKPLLYGL